MTYVQTKPDAGPSPFLDAPTIQTNFAQFGIVFANNHKALNKFGQGDHTTVIMENQTADPGVTTSLDALYNKNASATTGGPQPQLFIQIPKFLPTQYDTNNIQNVGMQLTYNSVNTAGPVYQNFLPGGYLIYFGSTTNAAVPITLSPIPSNIIVANATMTTTTGGGVPFAVSTSLINSNSFQINTNATGVYKILWFVIGVA